MTSTRKFIIMAWVLVVLLFIMILTIPTTGTPEENYTSVALGEPAPVQNRLASDGLIPWQQPTWTSPTNEHGTITTSGGMAGNPGWQAFNGRTDQDGGQWIKDNGMGWIELRLNQPVFVTQIEITQPWHNDGSVWALNIDNLSILQGNGMWWHSDFEIFGGANRLPGARYIMQVGAPWDNNWVDVIRINIALSTGVRIGLAGINITAFIEGEPEPLPDYVTFVAYNSEAPQSTHTSNLGQYLGTITMPAPTLNTFTVTASWAQSQFPNINWHEVQFDGFDVLDINYNSRQNDILFLAPIVIDTSAMRFFYLQLFFHVLY